METRGALCQKGEEASAAGPKYFERLVGLLPQSHRYLTPLVLFVSWTQTSCFSLLYNLKMGFQVESVGDGQSDRWVLVTFMLPVQTAQRRMSVGDHFAWEPSVL